MRLIATGENSLQVKESQSGEVLGKFWLPVRNSFVCRQASRTKCRDEQTECVVNFAACKCRLPVVPALALISLLPASLLRGT
jgi:hypothetical protein